MILHKRNILCLFDVDGTLTEPCRKATPAMIELIRQLKSEIYVAFVGGSDLKKQQEQLGSDTRKAQDMFDYAFSENGLVAFKDSKEIGSASFIDYLGEEKYKRLVNFCLKYLASIEIPKKRGTFIEFRKGMVNCSPIGRNASYEERKEFEAYDKKYGIRKRFVETLKQEFAESGLQFSIGGQISFDIFPKGWNKTYCLQFVENEGFEEIHFFGDKTMEGGNDYDIYIDKRVIGHSVKSPDETTELVKKLFLN